MTCEDGSIVEGPQAVASAITTHRPRVFEDKGASAPWPPWSAAPFVQRALVIPSPVVPYQDFNNSTDSRKDRLWA